MTLALVLAVAATVAAVLLIGLLRDVLIASIALADAPEPYWGQIRATLLETRLARPLAVRIATRLRPPTAA